MTRTILHTILTLALSCGAGALRAAETPAGKTAPLAATGSAATSRAATASTPDVPAEAAEIPAESAFGSVAQADADAHLFAENVPQLPSDLTGRPTPQGEFAALKAADADSPFRRKKHFLPTRRRIDREINKIKFAYKGEVMMGLTASYGTLSSDDTDFMLIIDNIKADGTMATVKPFIGYFYRDNNCLGVRFGYSHVGGTVDAAEFDLGESNDVQFDIPYLDLRSDNYSFGIFHRSYAGLDPKGRFGLFAEFELAVSTGSSEFAYETGGVTRRTYSDNTQVKLSFNPGAAVYIFPNVCATLSFGLGGIQYTSVTQKDADGNKIGSRKASNMKFKLNIAAINIGMTIHMWDKKKK